MVCEHCRSSARADVCSPCWFAQLKANKRLLEINEKLAKDSIRLQNELDLAQDEIGLLRKTLSEKAKAGSYMRFKVKEG